MTHLVKHCTSLICRPKLHDLVAEPDVPAFLTLFLGLAQGISND